MRPAVAAAALWLAAAPLALAVVIPQDDAKHQDLAFSDPSLHPTLELEPVGAVVREIDAGVRSAWSGFSQRQKSAGGWNAHVDRRSGLIHIAEGAGVPWIPGHGALRSRSWMPTPT